MTWDNAGLSPNWSKTLNDAQVATVRRLRESHNGGPATNGQQNASEGWRVYMQPTTLPARYLELRHFQTDGKVSVWVIEPDGWVSRRRLQDATELLPRNAA